MNTPTIDLRRKDQQFHTEAGWLDTEGDLRLAPDIGRKLRTARGVRDVLREIRLSQGEREPE